jgi:hypothetical protein
VPDGTGTSFKRSTLFMVQRFAVVAAIDDNMIDAMNKVSVALADLG